MTLLLSTVIAGLLMGAVYALVSVGLALEFGVMRIINFAHGYFVMLAMFVAAVLWRQWGITPYEALVVLVPAGFVLGVLVHGLVIHPFVRRGSTGLVIALVTLALSVVVEQGVVALLGSAPRSVAVSTAGFSLLGIDVSGPRLVAAVVALAALVVLGLVLGRTRWGRFARAVAQDAESARTQGIDPTRVAAVVFGVGTAMAAVAGAALVTFLPATAEGGLTLSLVSFVIVVLGGLSSFAGALVAGLVIGVTTSLVGFYWDPALQVPSYLVILVLVLALRPQGLFGDKADAGEIHA
ncbi:branched-chain amino acid ABC transporter permease [Nocardioides humi]|uniref:Branched-chain amino acid ABC transporter permease n=1 Tax=Nocardioides humi TaxID=449461 RepID=A0ABN2A7I9_9ACTN|nr:branched-chain amino acid ABC transporter permease [Nocardioides humi]